MNVKASDEPREVLPDKRKHRIAEESITESGKAGIGYSHLGRVRLLN